MSIIQDYPDLVSQLVSLGAHNEDWQYCCTAGDSKEGVVVTHEVIEVLNKGPISGLCWFGQPMPMVVIAIYSNACLGKFSVHCT